MPADTAVEAETFDLVAALEGTSYPTTTVPIYLNIKAVADFHNLEEEAAALTDSAEDVERNDEILVEQAALREQILNSMLNIEMIGVPRSVIKAIGKKIEATVKDKTLINDKVNRAILIRSITKVSNRVGQTAEATEEAIDALIEKMTNEVYDSFIEAMWKLSFESMRYESTVTDPNFS
ncbi:MAG: hypothetical protein WC322_04705 [Candidatus Paceibacterota bacterium]|jgi:hypothetical protein